MVTAIIGDVASHFGCTLGIKDSVTAIVFVALGTSIPGNIFFYTSIKSCNLKMIYKIIIDTFASKVAAIQDKYADASVGNVTGSNAVNVFLGIGKNELMLLSFVILRYDSFIHLQVWHGL